ncbi:DNA-binding protein WhiA [Alkalibacter rhizosphaerae]|uniref:Probable cell division protein WhiA n=1 Tax=Alkalibacter rhizosphaerae TaxID=2815577 RepID=A0A974XFK2_9FIRM|nr:DNA-binding protein WhiA [Alkalibacter rhizosphaerae]QSX07815.1 DNA-binding protein WhiA [Alkalibacter rhizosphaerae]
MSFSSKTKSDLSRLETNNREILSAELSALIHMGGSLKYEGVGEMTFQIKTENAAIARHAFKSFKAVYRVEVEVVTSKNKQFKNRNVYTVRVVSPQEAMNILQDLGIVGRKDGYLTLLEEIPQRFQENRETRKAYLRGAFLGAGSISDPEKTYHLEFVTSNEEYAVNLMKVINSFDLTSKIIERKGNFVVYLKDSEQIITLLSIIGAHSALLDIENIRIVKDMRNNVNRIVNCETANLTKTVEAAWKQVDCIERIRKTIGLDKLPPNLREIAELRMNNQEASLKELGEMMDPPMGKSGINHRLKKIVEIAEQL